jgi:hypothetical protein
MSAPDGYPHKDYLGDGAYIQQGSYLGEVVLTTEDGIREQNRVVLGPMEIVAFRRWCERVNDINKLFMEKEGD